MPERLTPPIRYPDPDDRGRKARRGKRAQQPQGGEKIVRPKKGLGFKDISKSDIFVTGAFDVPFFCAHHHYSCCWAGYAVFGVLSLFLF